MAAARTPARTPATAARTRAWHVGDALPHLLLRLALAVGLLVTPMPIALDPAAWGIAVALLTGIAFPWVPLTGAALLIAAAAFGLGEPLATLPLAGAAVATAMLGPGPLARWRRWPAGASGRTGARTGARRTDGAPGMARYGVFALRIVLGAPLLGGGLALLTHGALLGKALGVAWMLGGLGLALGVLAPWAGLYAALALPLAIPLGGGPAWAALAGVGLAMGFTHDTTLALDARIEARGGVFPTVRRRVVLAPHPRGRDVRDR